MKTRHLMIVVGFSCLLGIGAGFAHHASAVPLPVPQLDASPPAATPAPADSKPATASPGAQAATPAPAVAPAAPEAKPANPDAVDSAKDFATAVRAGNWRMAVAAVLALLMMILGKTRDSTIFRGDRGGAILVMLLSLAGGLSTALSTGMPVDFKMLLGVIGTAFTAVGGYTWIRRLFWPVDKGVTAKA